MASRSGKRKVDDIPSAEERYFLNPECVSRHLYCSICQEVFSQPQRLPCGHSFCRKCITTWLQKSKTCPEDRKPVHTNQLHHDFILENIIGDHKVACPFRALGCQAVTQLHLLSSHTKACDFNPSNQPDFLRRRVLQEANRAPVVLDDSAATDADSEEEGAVPVPGQPSLILRLFQADSQKKEMLKAMFDKKS